MEKLIIKNELELEVYYNGIPKVANMPIEFLELFAGCLEEKIYIHFQNKFKRKSRCTKHGTQI